MTTSSLGPISRRGLLLGAAGATVFGGIELAQTSQAAAGSRVTVLPPTAGAGGVTKPPTPIPAWAQRWHSPVYDIRDFRRRMPGARFPARPIMLTIDDGPSPVWTPKYLRLLARHNIRATFCLIGQQVPANRALVRAAAAEGHTLANHTWTHDEYLPSRSAARIHREISWTNDAIHTAAGVRPHIFRAPGGNWGPAVFNELAQERMLPLGWDIDPRDWARPGTGSIERAMLRTQPQEIILCHDGGGDRSETYAALEYVIPRLLHRGLEFVTLPLPR